jgi:hypothetical protein
MVACVTEGRLTPPDLGRAYARNPIDPHEKCVSPSRAFLVCPTMSMGLHQLFIEQTAQEKA